MKESQHSVEEGEEKYAYMRKHPTLAEVNAGEQAVELLIVTDGELDMTRDDALLLVVAVCRVRMK
jgi:hypothetical protein